MKDVRRLYRGKGNALALLGKTAVKKTCPGRPMRLGAGQNGTRHDEKTAAPFSNALKKKIRRQFPQYIEENAG